MIWFNPTLMEKLTKKEKKELKKTEEQQKLELQKKQNKIKTIGIILGVIVFIALAWILIIFAKEQNKTEIPPISQKDVLIGPKDAKVQIVEYADFECPACASYPPVIKQLLESNKDNLSFTYRFFPLTQIHKHSRTSAQAAYAANKQGKFMEMYELLYANQQSWTNLESVDAIFADYAKEIELDVEKFKKDYKSKEVSDFVIESENQAINLGLFSTPTFFVNGNLVEPKNAQDLGRIVTEELNK